MPVSVRFALRSPGTGNPYANPHPLQVWIRVHGKRKFFGAVWPIQSGDPLRIDPADWRVSEQRSARRDDPINRKLNALRAHIEQIYDAQAALAAPTIDSVVFELTEQKQPAYDKKRGWVCVVADESTPGNAPLSEESSFLDAYRSYVLGIKIEHGPKPSRKQHVAAGRWDRGLFLLEEWERQLARPVPICARVTLTWLRDYHKWLQRQKSDKQTKPISEAMASRYIGKIGMVLQWMVDDDLLPYNAVKKTTWPTYSDKEVMYLEPEQIRHLFTLRWRGTKADVLWWFLLMCCTGMDYPDAMAYAADRSKFERMGPSGMKLIAKRNKAPYEEFELPLLREVHWLFAAKPKGAQPWTGNTINNHTEHIEDELGVTWRITAKIARKTFACLMLNNGVPVSVVSRMLGHSNTTTTERHYVKVIGSAVDTAWKKTGRDSLL